MSDIFMILVGLVLLFFGGEALIKGAVSLAKNLGLSRLLVSVVIVGFGTSMPEMTVSIGAALKGASDIAIGNVVGSNIANILLIIGLSALLCPIYMTGTAVIRDTFFMLGASLALCALSLLGGIDFMSGLVLFAAVLFYVVYSYLQDKKQSVEAIAQTSAHIIEDIEAGSHLNTPKAAGFAFLGLVMLIAGAYFLVEGAVSIARSWGVSEAVIGLTIVAVGTSLPELATSLVAAYRKHSDVIIGNIVGSNIFNILAILGLSAMTTPLTIDKQIATYDVWIMLAVAIWLSIYLILGKKISTLSGLVMLLAYFIYTFALYTNSLSI